MSNPDIVFASGPTYNNGTVMLMPFTYSNGKLDLKSGINYGGSNVLPGNEGASIRRLGGNFQVTSIGTTLTNYIQSKVWDNYTVVAGSVRVASPALVTRVQQLSSDYLPATWDDAAYKVKVGEWNRSNFIGPESVFLFTKPLVLQMNAKLNNVGSAVPICITLTTSWDH